MTDALVVDLDDRRKPEVLDDGTTVDFGQDGAITVDFEPNEPGVAGTAGAAGAHDENLAEVLDRQILGRIAVDIIQSVDIDIESRKEWEDKFTDGLEILGIRDERRDGAFRGATSVTHPLLIEAMMHFQARAIAELFPSEGPVRAAIMGKETEEKIAQRDRVKEYMNYQLVVEDKGHFHSTDQAMLYLPYSGSVFKKVFRDTVRDRNASRMVSAEDFIVPYNATSLEDAPRYTHRIPLSPNALRKLQRSGAYRWTDDKIPEPAQDTPSPVKAAVDAAEGRTSESNDSTDWEHAVYEVHIDYDVPGYEDLLPDGKTPSGVGLPYIISIERDSQEVLAIRRNYREGDPLMEKRIWFVHYRYFPGFGFYGYGLLHAIGGLSRAATGAMRALLDASAFATLQGGFRSKDARIPAGELTIEPGIWLEVESNAEDLQKAFYTPPFKEPSPALFQMLGFLVESGQRFASTTEAMVGDASNEGPVGTTVALIEQGSKVYSAIHKRCHMSAGEEYQLLYELNSEHIPPEGYAYQVEGGQPKIYQEDFSAEINVVPVSDPNFFSATQRVATGQALLQMAAESPEIYEKRETHLFMLQALRVPNLNKILPAPEDPEPRDPVSENMALLMGKPIRAFPNEDHAAHVVVHMDFMQHDGFGGNKLVAEKITPRMLSHLGEHMAYLYQLRMEALQVPTAEIDLHAGRDKPMLAEPRDHKGQNMIAAIAAQVSDQFKDAPGMKQPEPDDGGKEAAQAAIAKAKIRRDDELAKAAEARKDAGLERDQARKDATVSAELDRKDSDADEQIMRENMQSAAEIRRDDRESVAGITREDEESDETIDRDDRESAAGVRRDDRDSEAANKRAVKEAKAKATASSTTTSKSS